MNTVMIREDGNWYSVKKMCELSNTSRQTWMNFKNDSNCKTTFTVRRNLRKGDKNVEYYPESALKQFQLWLKKKEHRDYFRNYYRTHKEDK